jgi:putative transposase
LELNSFSRGYGQITYHLVLVPKYRYNIFYNKLIKKDCELILTNICMEQGYKLHAMEVVDDHVHLFVEFHPSNSLSEVVQYLKGGSSYRLFKLHPELKKRYWGGSLWSRGKFYRSVGNVTADTIKHYIKESQKKPKEEFKASKSAKLGQRMIEDFYSHKPGVRPEAYPIL